MKKIGVYLILVIVLLVTGGLFMYEKPLTESEISTLYVDSEALHKKMPLNLYLPKGYSKNKTYPVLYLLHGFGLSDKEDQWLPGIFSKELIDEMIEQREIEPLIVVSPLYGASCGYDTHPTEVYDDKEHDFSYGLYETYVIKELMSTIEKQYSVSTQKDETYIGGFSGGANAAIYYALTYPERFGKVGLFCPALNTSEQLESRPDLSAFLYPTPELRAKRDPLLLIEDAPLKAIDILIESPQYDKWIMGATMLHEKLLERGISHTYNCSEELSHSPRSLRKEAQRYLDFFSK